MTSSPPGRSGTCHRNTGTVEAALAGLDALVAVFATGVAARRTRQR